MDRFTAVLTLLLLVPAPGSGGRAAAPAPGPAADEPASPADDATPPPGSAADQALWRRASDANLAVPGSRLRSSRLQLRAKGYGLPPGLEAIAAAGGPGAERARALLAALHARWRENLAVLGERWPVDPTRVCGYDLLLFDSSMRAGNGPGAAAQLAAAREQLLACLGRADLVLARMSRVNDAFEAAIVDAETAIAAERARTSAEAAAAVAPGGRP